MDISRNDNIALCAYYRALADVSVYSYRSVIKNVSVKTVDVSVYDKNVLTIYPVFCFIKDYVAVFFRKLELLVTLLGTFIDNIVLLGNNVLSFCKKLFQFVLE